MVNKKKIAEWARSMCQLMEQVNVTNEDVLMLLEAHNLPLPEETTKHWTEIYE